MVMKQVITLIACATLFMWSCHTKQPGDRGWSEAIAVETMVVADADAMTERNYVGDIGSEQEVTVSFPLGGTLTKVAVKNGDRVAKGQLLAEVDATTAASLHATALATLRQAEDAYRRLENVHREGGISEVKWVEMETNLEKARQAEVSARKHKEDCSIRAPFSGVVSCADRYVGQELKPGEPFCRVLDMNRLRVGFSVPEQEIGLIKTGDAATATIPALGDAALTLRVSDKSLMANPLGHTYKVYAKVESGERRVENGGRLLPDMVAKVKVRLNAVGGILVPADCVQTMPEGNIVWVVENGRAQHRLIAVGDFARNSVVVKEGLKANDTVVIAGQQKLYTGAKVVSGQ